MPVIMSGHGLVIILASSFINLTLLTVYFKAFFSCFSELIAWLGMSILYQHSCLYLSWLTMVAYLSGRSHQTRLWYLKKFDKFPQHLKNLFPGIYWFPGTDTYYDLILRFDIKIWFLHIALLRDVEKKTPTTF